MDTQEIQIVIRQEINSSSKILNIENKVSTLEQDVSILKQDVSILKQDVSILKQDVSILKQDVSILKQDVSILKQDVSILKQDVSILKQDVSRIGILQEELNSKMDFVLEALQPVIEKVQSVNKIESDLVRHDEDIDVTKNALRSHITDNTRHV